MPTRQKTGRTYDPRLIGATALAALALLGTLAAPASAAPRDEKPSRVTVRFDVTERQFRGHVDASRRCTPSRTIVVYTRSIGRDTRVGKGRTGRKGGYRVDPNQLIVGADYYAIARPGGNGTNASCDKAVSKRFRIGA